MATLTATVEAYASYASSLRRRNSVHSKLPAALHNVPPESRSASPTDVSELTFHSPVHVLSFLRLHVLRYLANLECHLSSLEPSLIVEALKAKGEQEAEEVKVWVKSGLDKLVHIRADVLSHLPECRACKDGSDHRHHMSIHIAASSEKTTSSHEVYVPTLSQHLHSLQAHLLSLELPHIKTESHEVFRPHATVHELIELAIAPKFSAPNASEAAESVIEVARALEKSRNGEKLIEYNDLPAAWKHNPLITQGYRFIPPTHWYRIVQSMFTLHNETLNIHTHFIPFLFWAFTLYPFSPLATKAALHEPAELLYLTAGLLCLLGSSIYHAMSCCSHAGTVAACAKFDYIGIGWFMCITLYTTAWYAFRQHPTVQTVWMVIVTAVFISSCVFPLMDWFNDHKYRHVRIGYFTCIGFCMAGPGLTLAYMYGSGPALVYMRPVFEACLSYFVGMCFYATHFPEAYIVRPGQKHWLDWCGGGSHAIWHCIAVFGVTRHVYAFPSLKAGVIV